MQFKTIKSADGWSVETSNNLTLAGHTNGLPYYWKQSKTPLLVMSQEQAELLTAKFNQNPALAKGPTGDFVKV